MKSLEISGRTVEEAIQKALDQLGVSQEEVEVTIVKEGKQGILGVGAEEATVRVQPLAGVTENNDVDIAEIAKTVLETLLARMGIEASVVSQTQPPAEGSEGASGIITLNVTGDDLGILIGRRGQNLASLQYIARIIVAHQAKTRVPIVIDVEEYKQRRSVALQALAWRVAEQVKARGKPFTLEPMPAYERRIIHLALADSPDVTTESSGEGEFRKVTIMPKKSPQK